MSDTGTRDPLAEDRLSDRQRNVLNVVRAGKSKDLDELMDRLTKSAHASYAQVANDDTRTDEWKSQELDHIHKSTMASLDSELAQMAKPLASNHRDDFGVVFGTAGLQGDAASLAISRRDAGDRVATVHSTEDLLQLLERANLSGDEVLARAVAEKAYTDGNAKVLERFAESRPALDDAVERLWNRRRDRDRESQALFGFTMRMSALRPGSPAFTFRG